MGSALPCKGAGGADEVYGIYAGPIREGVANCADYVDRLIGQLEAVPDRHYVAQRAETLRRAAGSLVGLCHDVEVWLRYCGKPVPFGDSGFSDECVLPAGHGGGCSADVPASALEVARRGADGVATVATDLADLLGWLVHDPGRLRDPSRLEELGRTYQKLDREVDRLSPFCRRFARRRTARSRGGRSPTARATRKLSRRRRSSSAPSVSSRRRATSTWPGTGKRRGTESVLRVHERRW